MANVRYLRKLPQRSGLTGMSTRTPIEQLFSERRSNVPLVPENIPSRGLEALSEQKRPQSPTQVLTSFSDLGGGPGVAAGAGTQGGIDSPGVATDPNDVSTMVGNQMASSMFGRGVKGVTSKGLTALASGFPISAIAPNLASLAVTSAFAPLSIASMIAGGIQSGNAATEAQNALQAENISPHLTSQTTKGIIDATYTSNPLSVISNMFTKDPSKFAKQVSELTIANAPFYSGTGEIDAHPDLSNFETNEALNEQAFATDQALAVAMGSLSAAAPPTAPQSPAYTVSGGGIQGVSPTGQTGHGSLGQSPTGEVGGGAAPSVGQGGGSPGVGTPGAGVSGQGGSDYGGGETGDVGPGVGGGNGTVVCTEMHRQGLMPDHIYKADSDYGDRLPNSILQGYYVIGKPIARVMAKSKVLTLLIKPVVLAWAYQMAFKEGVVAEGNKLGAAIEKVGIPLCKVLFILKSIVSRRSLERQPHRALNLD